MATEIVCLPKIILKPFHCCLSQICFLTILNAEKENFHHRFIGNALVNTCDGLCTDVKATTF